MTESNPKFLALSNIVFIISRNCDSFIPVRPQSAISYIEIQIAPPNLLSDGTMGFGGVGVGSGVGVGVGVGVTDSVPDDVLEGVTSDEVIFEDVTLSGTEAVPDGTSELAISLLNELVASDEVTLDGVSDELETTVDVSVCEDETRLFPVSRSLLVLVSRRQDKKQTV